MKKKSQIEGWTLSGELKKITTKDVKEWTLFIILYAIVIAVIGASCSLVH